ncbi:MAG: hypothetical protein AAGD25_05710 [Cyanobacteria bacterium P01_F01_bin.150]
MEGHEDSLFIDRIEISLLDINIPSDVILVDLPGLAVSNQRHIEFTKYYIQEKAKAFVVCMKPRHLLEGQEIQFLEATNRSNPTILQRSFWVINQWDTLDDQQKQEEEENFNQKIKQYGFVISHERVFKFSALNYLLLSCIKNKTINDTNKLKYHQNNLAHIFRFEDDEINPENFLNEQARLILSNEVIKPFLSFKNLLFGYLETTAKDEFIEDARGELIQLLNILETDLRPHYNHYSQTIDLGGELRAVEVSKQSDYFINKLNEKVEAFTQEARSKSESIFWEDSNTSKVEREISIIISELNRENLKNEIFRGIDNQGNLGRLPFLIDKEIGLTILLRQKMVETTEKIFIHLLNKFLLEFKEINKDYLPDSVSNKLTDKLSNRDIIMRLNGLADSLFYNYGKKLEEIGLSLHECAGNTREERINSALNKYKDELKIFIKELVDDLNKYISISVKNHVEQLEKDLVNLIKDWHEPIRRQVARKIKMSEAIAHEQQKQMAIKNSYTELINLTNSL